MNSARAESSQNEEKERMRFVKRFSTPAERGGKKNEKEGRRKRNSDYVLWQSISEATNGCSEKVN